MTSALVIGGGVAGAFTALRLAALGVRVTVLTKGLPEEGNTRWAQGGVAAVTGHDDDVELHVADTVAAGAGLCDGAAVRVLCTEGPDRIVDLLALAMPFDGASPTGANELPALDTLARGREAAHSRRRVLHAGGDATGRLLSACLTNALRASPLIDLRSHHLLVDLVLSNNEVTGATVLSADGHAERHLADVVVLATGGAGQVYRHTTNPSVATGDGVAAAWRAGAVITDAEFFQFHPTVLALPGSTPFLISEAVRGEGALLRSPVTGDRFVDELAPRDIVARAIAQQMAEHDGRPVVLDATAIGRKRLAERFPTIDAACRDQGIDWAVEPVPVVPAAHSWMGGVATDLEGRSSVPGLFAVGEVAATGVHGANRLASNSLLEGLVFGRRVANAFAFAAKPSHWPTDPGNTTEVAAPSPTGRIECLASVATADDIRHVMWQHVGLVRDRHGLTVAHKQFEHWLGDLDHLATETLPTSGSTELRNLNTVAHLVTLAALTRTESRGAHARSDFPLTDTGQSARRGFRRVAAC